MAFVASSTPVAGWAPYGNSGTIVALGRAVTVAGHDGARGRQQARSVDHAFVDGALDADIGVSGAFGTGIAQRRNAGLLLRRRWQ
ncbi:MAG: hypothetical protein M3Y65_04220 [Pseudomonadota bacterium]|nr:hypothetical protein [Pseudomonadota bacterium]